MFAEVLTSKRYQDVIGTLDHVHIYEHGSKNNCWNVQVKLNALCSVMLILKSLSHSRL